MHKWARRAAVLAFAAGFGPVLAHAQPSGTLRIAMTASDVPTSTGMPNNGFEGMRFLGYPIFEGLVQWDLSRSDVPATIKPALAESWEQDPKDPTTWIFHLRHNVKFHDGTPFNADAVIWNMDRYYKSDSPQFEPAGSAVVRSRVPGLESYKKIDDYTVAIKTSRPISYWPYLQVYILFTSPHSWEAAGHDWGKVALHPAGTGPFKLTNLVPRQSVELTANTDYWDKTRIPKLEHVVLIPMPEANTRVAALRSGQVDWIEVPAPDAIPSLKEAGFNVVTNTYPHLWPWIFGVSAPNSPFKDVRVRRAVNYCVDRDGLVSLLNGTAEPATGLVDESNPAYGKPTQHYNFDPKKAKALLAEAGYNAQHPLSFKVAISTSGSGQMTPQPMNEALQQSMKENCGINVSFVVVEWNTLLGGMRGEQGTPSWLGADALNISEGMSDAAQVGRYFLKSSFSPNGSNSGHWTNPDFEKEMKLVEEAKDPKTAQEHLALAHAILVDDAPYAFIVHDLNPRAMSKKVHGFVSAQSWFQDLTPVSISK